MANNDEQKAGSPPPPEITIRTMKSDLKSVASGEATPTPEKVTAKELEKISAGAVKVVSETIGGEKPKPKRTVLVVIIIAVLVIGLAALAYFLITK